MSTKTFPLVWPEKWADTAPPRRADPGVGVGVGLPEGLRVRSGGLSAQFLPVQDLPAAAVDEMLGLFEAHFHVPFPEAFRRDLTRKQLVIQFRDQAGALQGFSTITSFRTRFRGRWVGVIYSGDTVICPDHWGTSILPKAWLTAVLELGRRLPKPLYWLLLSSGYKTYRMLPVFFKEFFPRFDRGTPESTRALTRQLASQVAGEQFHPREGIIRFDHGATPLRAGVAEPDGRRLENPHTAFFMKRNPGHIRGDELVCIAEVADENLSRGGRRILRALGLEELR